MISIVVPIHNMEDGDKFLWRNINSILDQSYKDYEIIICKEGSMPVNTNYGIKKAKGEFIKILFLDDYLAHKDSLKEQVESIKGNWLMCGTDDNEIPYLTNDIEQGNNKLGSPSALMIRNDNPLLFDENMSWLLDCDYYKRMYDKYGEPDILDGVHVILGKGKHQVTNTMSREEKLKEEEYLNNKYA